VTRSSSKLHPEEKRTLISTIGKHDEFISPDEKIGAAIRMNQISTNIAALISLWKKQKEEYKKTKPNKGSCCTT